MRLADSYGKFIVPSCRFRYTTALKNAFSGGGISSLESFDNLGMINLFILRCSSQLVYRLGGRLCGERICHQPRYREGERLV